MPPLVHALPPLSLEARGIRDCSESRRPPVHYPNRWSVLRTLRSAASIDCQAIDLGCSHAPSRLTTSTNLNLTCRLGNSDQLKLNPSWAPPNLSPTSGTQTFTRLAFAGCYASPPSSCRPASREVCRRVCARTGLRSSREVGVGWRGDLGQQQGKYWFVKYAS